MRGRVTSARGDAAARLLVATAMVCGLTGARITPVLAQGTNVQDAGDLGPDGRGIAGQAIEVQGVEVLSKSVEVSPGVARLSLEFREGPDLVISLAEGRIEVNGRPIGSYSPGGALERSWRELVGRTAILDGAPLATALVEWSPPAGLDANASQLGSRIDQVLEASFRPAQAEATPPSGTAPSPAGPVDPGILARLAERQSLLGGLAALAGAIDFDRAEIYVGEDLTIPVGRVVDGDLLVLGADLRIEGEVLGSVGIVDGTLSFSESGRVRGEAHTVGSQIRTTGNSVDGRIVRHDPPIFDRDAYGDRIRERALREGMRIGRERGLFPNTGRGIVGLFANAVALVLLAIAGWLVAFFAQGRLTRIATTVRDEPFRAGAVGLAGAFLTLPVWVVGGAALAISIVGIVALPFWAVLFPIAVVGAAVVGYFAVAWNLGHWLAGARASLLGWVRETNPLSLMLGGVGVLLLPFVVANVLRLFPGDILEAFFLLAEVAGVLITVGALVIGFGAVILTRGGQRRLGVAGVGGIGAYDDWDLDDPFAPEPGEPSGAPPSPGEGGDRPERPTSETSEAGTSDAPETPDTGEGDGEPEEPGAEKEES